MAPLETVHVAQRVLLTWGSDKARWDAQGALGPEPKVPEAFVDITISVSAALIFEVGL